jgi:predicted DsbA family dithiol-disulfide isomerase
MKAIVELFTSPTCPHCPPAKKALEEVAKERSDFTLAVYSTMTQEGQLKAEQYGIEGVPTAIISGPATEQPMGIPGEQSKKTYNDFIDIALGKKTVKEVTGKA